MSEIIEKKGVKVTIVEHEGGSEEFHVMEEKINEYLNTHSEVDGIFTEDVEAYFCLVQAKKRGISIPRDLKIVGYDGNESADWIQKTDILFLLKSEWVERHNIVP